MAISQSTDRRAGVGIRRRANGALRALVRAGHLRASRTFAAGVEVREVAKWRRETKKKLLEELRLSRGERVAYQRALPTISELPTREGCGAYVYFIQCEQFVKIGRAADPWYRLAELQTAHPMELRLVAAVPCRRSDYVEAAIQRMFQEQRVRGEWFRIDAAIVKLIARVCEGAVTDADFESLPVGPRFGGSRPPDARA